MPTSADDRSVTRGREPHVARSALAEPPAQRVGVRGGRRAHVIDRALDYVALAQAGHSASRIARLRRRSQSYVSIVLRLGRAISGMEPAELAALRSPRITWKLAQRIVRDDTDAVLIRQQLRTALSGFSTPSVGQRGRPRRTLKSRHTGMSLGTNERAAVPASAPGPDRQTFLMWDADVFDHDPPAFVVEYVAALLRQHRALQRAAHQAAVSAQYRDALSVGQSLRSLQQSLGRTSTLPQLALSARSANPNAPPANRQEATTRALDLLARVERALVGLAEEMIKRGANEVTDSLSSLIDR